MHVENRCILEVDAHLNDVQYNDSHDEQVKRLRSDDAPVLESFWVKQFIGLVHQVVRTALLNDHLLNVDPH